MFKSDFYRKKDFSNPMVPTKASTEKKPSQPPVSVAVPDPASTPTPTPATAPAPVPAVSEAKDVKDDTKEAEEIRPECLLKHPLQNKWTLWYLDYDRNKSWEEMQNEITSFDTVEDFWSLYNHIKPPSELRTGNDYSLFKKGVRPMWEDATNKEGGRWIITLKQGNKTDVDSVWMDVLLCLIGEAFDSADEVCGAVVNVRFRQQKISVWTRNGKNEQSILEIGHKLCGAITIPRQSLQYHLHKDSMVQQSFNVKPAFTL